VDDREVVVGAVDPVDGCAAVDALGWGWRVQGVRPRRAILHSARPAAATAEKPAKSGVVEVELAGVHRLRAEDGANLSLLQAVVAALLGR
jgi:hypothetical protein